MRPNSDKSRIPDYLFHIAQGFYEVGLHVAYQVNKDNSVKGFQRIAPAVVNFTFAIELMLKGLHSLTTKMDLRGHKLWDLYKLLSQDIKQKIEDKYNLHRETKSDELPSFRVIMKKANENETETPEEDSKENVSLRDLLVIHNNAFEDWRYLYEYSPTGYKYEFNFKLMDAFIKSLIEVINDVKSNLGPSFVIGRAK